MTQDTIAHPTNCACCGDMLRTRFDRRRFLHLTAGAGMLAAFPSLAFGAEGNYDAMLLTCIDPRFPEHRDCGAVKVANPQIETETHKAALTEFRKQVAEKQPSLKVELNLMALDGKVEMFG